jgi:NAD(P)H-quinone oxidoreductase subunit M
MLGIAQLPTPCLVSLNRRETRRARATTPNSQLPTPMLLKSTTRHVHIFTAEVKNNELIPSEQALTLDIDPDNELVWSEDALRKVYGQFDDLVESYSGADLTEYNLRRIGSDLEHFVRSLLQEGEIGYNLDSRVLNYSMGLPQVVSKSTD